MARQSVLWGIGRMLFSAVLMFSSCGGTGSGGLPPGWGGGGGGSGNPPTLDGCQVFPADNWWNTDISGYPVHPDSDAIIANIGANTNIHPDFGRIYGIPYVVVGSGQPLVPIRFTHYPAESDPGPYPVPADAPVEGGSDRHVIVVDTDNHMLYEMYYAFYEGPGWRAGCGAVFELTTNNLRPAGWTSADAAGLPIFPGLVRYDEAVEAGEINHALRFTVEKTRKGYVTPARHYASTVVSSVRPAMGMRVRLKANFDISDYHSECQVILRALKRYGMFVADHGSNWYISGAPDTRWNDDRLRQLRQVRGSSFEVIYTGEVIDGE
ncbi:MAG TPA: hypothetical protein ENN09_02565 [Planctomycetes bacterium]|nr:hypothetical protein [Planctomycetota bacterium]